MAIVFNGTTLNWYDDTIVFDGSTVSSPNDPGTITFNGTTVHGLTGFSSETTLYNFGLAPDSSNFENTIVPALASTYAEAFHSQSYTQGPGQDSTYTVYLKEGYRMVTSDGTFVGTASPGTSVALYEGKTVTGANTSHNGGTSVSLRRDNGV
jgi:hypothetical protein